MKLSPLLLFISLISLQLNAIPLKVPNSERYKNWPDSSQHPGQYPFIGYFAFRNVSDTVIDHNTEWFDPDLVEPGDIIYLGAWYLDWFVQHVHDQIRHPYILFTGDVGAWLPHPNHKKLIYDPKCAAWFCRNMVFSYHPKLIQIPTGQDLAQFDIVNPGVIKTLIDAVANKAFFPKKHFLYMCHFPRSFHGDRDKVVSIFENEPYCYSRNHSDRPFEFVDRAVYYEELSQSRFVISPLGLETDSVRTWEALVLDCIPIVEHTFLDPSYEKLPVVIVHDWAEVNKEFLDKKYEELKDKKSDEIYFDYWHNLLKDFQLRIRNNDLLYTQIETNQFSRRDLEDLSYILIKNKMADRPLLYKGFFSSIRPMQLLNTLPSISHISLHDPWIDRQTLLSLGSYLEDYSYVKNIEKIDLITSDAELFNELLFQIDSTVFLDLTYYRTSLFIDFKGSVINYGNFRQSLKQDLIYLYYQLAPGTLLCGNMGNNEYVNEILERFSKEKGLSIVRKGSFWYVMKD